MKKLLFILVITALPAGFAQAQTKKAPHQYYTAAWSVALPVFDYNEFIPSVSVNGAAFQVHFFLKENITAGVSFGWNTYYAEASRFLHNPSPEITVSGKSNHYLHTTPLKASVNYFFNTNPGYQPYIGLGLGGAYMTEHAVVQQVHFWDAQWSLLAAPEIGIFIPLAYRFGVHFSAAYTVNIHLHEFGQMQLKSIHTAGVSAGISYLL